MINVLIADDAAFIREMLYEELKREGYNIVALVSDGYKAFEAYKKFKPDIVIMDLVMEDHDGYEGLRRIMAVDKKAKIIVCSEIQSKELINKSVKQGACDFILKPFNIDRIKSSIKKNV